MYSVAPLILNLISSLNRLVISFCNEFVSFKDATALEILALVSFSLFLGFCYRMKVTLRDRYQAQNGNLRRLNTPSNNTLLQLHFLCTLSCACDFVAGIDPQG